jgi:hypothetical protein
MVVYYTEYIAYQIYSNMQNLYQAVASLEVKGRTFFSII